MIRDCRLGISTLQRSQTMKSPGSTHAARAGIAEVGGDADSACPPSDRSDAYFISVETVPELVCVVADGRIIHVNAGRADQAVRLRLMTPKPARPRLTMTTSAMAAMKASFEMLFIPIPSLVPIGVFEARTMPIMVNRLISES